MLLKINNKTWPHLSVSYLTTVVYGGKMKNTSLERLFEAPKTDIQNSKLPWEFWTGMERWDINLIKKFNLKSSNVFRCIWLSYIYGLSSCALLQSACTFSGPALQLGVPCTCSLHDHCCGISPLSSTCPFLLDRMYFGCCLCLSTTACFIPLAVASLCYTLPKTKQKGLCNKSNQSFCVYFWILF